MTARIRGEKSEDLAAIRAVNTMAFGRVDEANLVDALRNQGFYRLPLVAVASEMVVGHILFSELQIVHCDSPVNALALAPLAVLPAFQRRGIGSALVRQGLKLCAEQGHRIVFVLGSPNYYSRFGFSGGLARPLTSPYAGDAFMALELASGALEGVIGEVEYARPFADL